MVPAPHSYASFLRQRGPRGLVAQCIHNIYAKTNQMALDMPPPPAIDEGEVPSYVAICEQWLRKDTNQATASGIFVQEDESVCLDWTAPHYRLLELFGALIVDHVNDATRYRHDCYRSRTWDEALTGMDRTTVQQAISVARVEPREDMIVTQDVKDQCKICLEQLDLNAEQNHRVYAKATHHCLSWPTSFDGHNFTMTLDGTGVCGTKLVLPNAPSKPNIVPLSSIYKAVRSRLQHVAKIFTNVTDAPPAESESGVVIYVDTSSYAIDKTIFPLYFPPTVTSITVLSNPLCAVGYLPTGEVCSVYAAELVSYFQFLYPGLSSTGFQGGAGIRYQMAGSSAGLYSRMIMAKRLICPPHTINCLLPAFAKIQDSTHSTDAYVLESPNWGKAHEFFQVMGTNGAVHMEVVSGQGCNTVATDDAVPPTDDNPNDDGTSPPSSGENITTMPDFDLVDPPTDLPETTTSSGQETPPVFTDINEPVTEEGFEPEYVPPEPMTQEEIAEVTDEQVLIDLEDHNTTIPEVEDNPNVVTPDLEVVPTPEDVQTYVDANEPINVNMQVINQTERVTLELGLDIDLNMTTEESTPERFEEQREARQESEVRIEEESQAAREQQLQEAEEGLVETAPALEVEVWCPDFTEDGYHVDYTDGTVVTDRGTEILVSDGAGTVRFNRTDLEQYEQDVERFDNSTPYTEIYDPATDTNLTIHGSNLTYNDSLGVILPDPIGVVVVDNYTDPTEGTLVTDGATGHYKKEKKDKHKVYSGKVLSVGCNRDVRENDVVRWGRGYALRKDLDPGKKRTINGWWNGFKKDHSTGIARSGNGKGGKGKGGSSGSGGKGKGKSSSDTGGSGYQGEYNKHSRRKTSSSEDKHILHGGKSDDSTSSSSSGKGSKSKSGYYWWTSRKLGDQQGEQSISSEDTSISEDDPRYHQQQPHDGHRGVAIMVPRDEVKFGSPADMERLCLKHQDKVVLASRSRRTKEEIHLDLHREADLRKLKRHQLVKATETEIHQHHQARLRELKQRGASVVSVDANVKNQGASAVTVQTDLNQPPPARRQLDRPQSAVTISSSTSANGKHATHPSQVQQSTVPQAVTITSDNRAQQRGSSTTPGTTTRRSLQQPGAVTITAVEGQHRGRHLEQNRSSRNIGQQSNGAASPKSDARGTIVTINSAASNPPHKQEQKAQAPPQPVQATTVKVEGGGAAATPLQNKSPSHNAKPAASATNAAPGKPGTPQGLTLQKQIEITSEASPQKKKQTILNTNEQAHIGAQQNKNPQALAARNLKTNENKAGSQQGGTVETKSPPKQLNLPRNVEKIPSNVVVADRVLASARADPVQARDTTNARPLQHATPKETVAKQFTKDVNAGPGTSNQAVHTAALHPTQNKQGSAAVGGSTTKQQLATSTID